MQYQTLREKYTPFYKQLLGASEAAKKIDDTNVYQVANPKTKPLMDMLTAENILPGTRFEGRENFLDFIEQCNNGKHGLILMEHFSNTDLPSFIYLLEHDEDERFRNLAKKVVAIAGMKLNEDNPAVRAFAESFTRVVIYPTRSLESAEKKAANEEEKEAEQKKASRINLSAMHAMHDCKKRGEVILVFPSGTRYRPGRPETRRGLREIDSYIRMFDIALLVSVNGQILTIDPNNENDMMGDFVTPDKLIFTGSPVINCKEFRKSVLESLPEDEPDPKQKVIDRVMEILEAKHNEIEKIR